jgi:hypothetical protein
MSADATATVEAEQAHDGHEAHDGHPPWTPEQHALAGKIAVGFVVGAIMAGVIGPIALSVVIGLLQGYHRF